MPGGMGDVPPEKSIKGREAAFCNPPTRGPLNAGESSANEGGEKEKVGDIPTSPRQGDSVPPAPPVFPCNPPTSGTLNPSEPSANEGGKNQGCRVSFALFPISVPWSSAVLQAPARKQVYGWQLVSLLFSWRDAPFPPGMETKPPHPLFSPPLILKTPPPLEQNLATLSFYAKI